jgi:hypothetical protein
VVCAPASAALKARRTRRPRRRPARAPRGPRVTASSESHCLAVCALALPFERFAAAGPADIEGLGYAPRVRMLHRAGGGVSQRAPAMPATPGMQL